MPLTALDLKYAVRLLVKRPLFTLVTVLVTPVGNDYANALSRSVMIRLTRPGVILPPSGGPKADFFFSPTAPKESETILFDGSTSTDPDGTDDIVSYQWGFGDGAAKSGLRVTHAFELAGTYNVTLVVTDKLGRSSQIVKSVTVTAATGGAVHDIPTLSTAGISAMVLLLLALGVFVLRRGTFQGGRTAG